MALTRAKRLTAAIFAVVIMMFIASCSSGSGGGSGGGGGGGIPGTSLPGTPSVSGGGISRDLEAQIERWGLPNDPVTTRNIEYFLEEVYFALRNESGRSRSARSTRSDRRPEERWEWSSNWKESTTFIGNFSGRVETSYSEEEGGVETDNTWKEVERGTGTVRYFDFSNSGDLFFGGALGGSFVEIDEYDGRRETESEEWRINGTLRFAGLFEGRIVFDNYRIKYTWDGRRETEEVISGSFYVADRNGRKIVDLEPNDMWDFIFPYSEEREPSGNRINVPKMPNVPNASGGRLSNNGGRNEIVSSRNLDDFLDYFQGELRDNSRSRSSEWTWRESAVQHGWTSGHFSFSSSGSGKGADLRFGYEDAGSGTSTIQYFDYSNNGDLFIGGALGEAFISHYRWNNNNSSDRIEMEEQRINGTINFNGRFEGSIVFENFQVETDWSSWTTRRITNGRVVLRSGGNNIDISDDMMDFRISYW